MPGTTSEFAVPLTKLQQLKLLIDATADGIGAEWNSDMGLYSPVLD